MMNYDKLLDAWLDVCENEIRPPAFLYDPGNFYFNVFDNEDEGIVAVVTPKCLWDVEMCICDQGTANLLMRKLGGFDLMESVYEFEGEIAHSPEKLIAYLTNNGLEHNTSIDFPY